jgi:hypothetical protein
MDTQTQNPTQSAAAAPPEVTPEQRAELDRQLAAQLQAEQDGVNAVAAAAEGNDGIPKESEIDGLDFLLGAPQVIVAETTVRIVLPNGGTQTLVFVIKQMDGRKLDRIEADNTHNGRPDMITINSEVCAAAVLAIISPNGKTIAPQTDERWLNFKVLEDGEVIERRLPSRALAFEKRFRTQSGLLGGVADQVRKLSGFEFSAVGEAKPRVLSGAEAEAWMSTAAGN